MYFLLWKGTCIVYSVRSVDTFNCSVKVSYFLHANEIFTKLFLYSKGATEFAVVSFEQHISPGQIKYIIFHCKAYIIQETISEVAYPQLTHLCNKSVSLNLCSESMDQLYNRKKYVQAIVLDHIYSYLRLYFYCREVLVVTFVFSCFWKIFNFPI